MIDVEKLRPSDRDYDVFSLPYPPRLARMGAIDEESVVRCVASMGGLNLAPVLRITGE